jgi:hypothetical protein
MITTYLEKLAVGIATAIVVGTLTYLWGRRDKLYNWMKVAKHSSFSTLFSEIERHSVRYNKLKIIANSTNALLPAFQESKITVKECEILLRRPKDDELEFSSFLKTVEQDWRDLVARGRISNLAIRYVDDLLLDWQAIFDDEFMMLGLNSFDRQGWKKYNMIGTFLVSKSSHSSKELIEKYTSRFDMVFKNCSDNRSE